MSRSWIFNLSLVLCACLSPGFAFAQSGTWTNTAGGSWPVSGNWFGGTIADGTGNTADFGTLDIGADATVTLDGARTIGNLTFGDTAPSHNWILNTGSGGTLTLDGGTPTITVTNQTATINAAVGGSNGLLKSGAGRLVLSNAGNSFAGGVAISGGTVQISAATHLPSSNALTFSGSGTLEMTGAMTLANSVTIAGGQSGILKLSGAAGLNHISGNYSGVAGTLTLDTSGVTGFNGFYVTSTTGPALGAVVNVVAADGTNTQIYNNSSLTTQAFFANAKVSLPTSGTANLILNGGNGVGAPNLQFGALDGGVSSANPAAYLNTTIGFDNRTGTVTINGTADGNFSGTIWNGNNSGPAVVIKNGTSTQTFSGTNSYTGGTTVTGGILQIGAATNLPIAGGLTLSGGGALNMTAGMTLANSVTVAVGQTGTLKMVGATSGTLTGNYAGMAGTLTLDVSGGSGYTGFLINSSTGPALGAIVNILGTTSANNVQVGNNASLASQAFFANSKVSITASGGGNTYLAYGNGVGSPNAQFGALDGGNATTLIGFDNRTGTVTIQGTADGNFAGNIFNGFGGGPASVVKNGSSTQIFSGTNSYTGTTTINDGILQIGAAANLPAASALTLAGGGALNMSANMTLANSVAIVGGQSGTLKMIGATTGTLSGNYAAVAGTLTLDVSDGSGYTGFLVGSANGPALGSVVNVIGPASGTGNTQIGLNNLAYQAFFANAKVSFSNTGNIFVAGGNGSATNISFGALDGGLTSTNTGTNQGTTIGFDNRTGTVTISGTANGNFAGTIFNGNGSAGALNVIKNGSSVQTFSGTNIYTGTTLVSNGTLLVNGTHTGGAGYTVVSGATLGGSGSTGSTLDISGTLSPGASIESFASRALTMNSGSTFVFEAVDNTSTGADLMAVNGALSLTNVSLDLTNADLDAGTWSVGDKLTLISYNTNTVTSGFAGYANDTTYTFGTNQWLFKYDDSVAGNNYQTQAEATGTQFVTMTLVPEPSSLAMLAFSMLSLWLFRKRN